MPRNNLLDLLFGLFKEREFWSIKVLREKTQQPEAWLKELLSGIAMLHRSGEHNGMWELNSNYKGRDVRCSLGSCYQSCADDVLIGHFSRRATKSGCRGNEAGGRG